MPVPASIAGAAVNCRYDPLPRPKSRPTPARPDTSPMFVPLLVVKNAFRHKLRTALTVVGIVVAITAFGLLRTIVDAWYAGANASSSARLVTRSSVSLVFQLPLTYAQKIRQIDGVQAVSWMNWFGGVYITERNFFPQFAVDARELLRPLPGVHALAGGAQGLPHRSPGRDRRAQARRAVRLEGRRHDSAARHDLPGNLDIQPARHLRRRRQEHRPVADVLPLGPPQRAGQEDLPAPRRPGRALRRAAEGSAAGGRGLVGDRRDVQELAGRDPVRDREGVPAVVRRDDRGDPARDPGGELRRRSSSSWR